MTPMRPIKRSVLLAEPLRSLAETGDRIATKGFACLFWEAGAVEHTRRSRPHMPHAS
jgi:hypothetical protein